MSAPIGVIGGSGLYELLDDPRVEHVATPYGAPSSSVSLGTIGGRDVAFITRHGRDHEIAPHKINYRANAAALREVGVQRLVTSSAVGSLRADYRVGDFVFCDQFVDRTSGRIDTFYDGPKVVHVSVADPYCPQLREVAIEAARERAERFQPTGTAVVIQGPRFSTRAESRWFAAMGWDVVSMTHYPETVLARELAMCCVNISFITDYDAGSPAAAAGADDEPVTARVVWGRLRDAQERITTLIGDVVAAIPEEHTCTCGQSLAGL